MYFNRNQKKETVRFDNEPGIKNLHRIDQELRSVFASLSPSLEALSKLAPIDQVGKIRSLIHDLQDKAGVLAAENTKITELVNNFEGELTSGGIKESNYISNLYKDKIMSKQFQKVGDPNCNKQVQVKNRL